MTTELIQRFATDHGISKIRAMIVISELLGKEKASAPTETAKDMIPNFSVEQIGW